MKKTKTKTVNIYFKAGNKNSTSLPAYKQIIKSGDLKYDENNTEDDAIILYIKQTKIIIDCDRKTRTFKIQWNTDNT